VIFVIIDDSGIVIGLRSRAREETLIYFNGGEGSRAVLQLSRAAVFIRAASRT
jgi:hypothetical protein